MIFNDMEVIPMEKLPRITQEAEAIAQKRGYYITPYEWNEMMKTAGRITALLSGPAATTMTYEKAKIILEIVMDSIGKVTE